MRPKPLYGSPCNRCGLCCLREQCPLSLLFYGRVAGVCPSLKADGIGGYYCAMVTAAALTEDERLVARRCIGEGTGCDALFTHEDWAKRESDGSVAQRVESAEATLSPSARRVLIHWRAHAARGQRLPARRGL